VRDKGTVTAQENAVARNNFGFIIARHASGMLEANRVVGNFITVLPRLARVPPSRVRVASPDFRLLRLVSPNLPSAVSRPHSRVPPLPPSLHAPPRPCAAMWPVACASPSPPLPPPSPSSKSRPSSHVPSSHVPSSHVPSSHVPSSYVPRSTSRPAFRNPSTPGPRPACGAFVRDSDFLVPGRGCEACRCSHAATAPRQSSAQCAARRGICRRSQQAPRRRGPRSRK
jgi:hypothetical protein